jgi:hypothetical protein
MANKALVVGSVLGVLIAPAVYKNYSSQNIPTNSGPVRAASAAEPPNCPHGLEPGGGPMRCADPNDPNSYLFKKANQQAQRPTKSQTKNTGVYSIENPPKNDNTWCRTHAKNATQLDRCWRRQHNEPMPEDVRANPNPKPGGKPGYGVICPTGTARQGQWRELVSESG